MRVNKIEPNSNQKKYQYLGSTESFFGFLERVTLLLLFYRDRHSDGTSWGSRRWRRRRTDLRKLSRTWKAKSWNCSSHFWVYQSISVCLFIKNEDKRRWPLQIQRNWAPLYMCPSLSPGSIRVRSTNRVWSECRNWWCLYLDFPCNWQYNTIVG